MSPSQKNFFCRGTSLCVHVRSSRLPQNTDQTNTESQMEKLRSTDLLNQFSQRKMKTNLIKQEDLVSYTRRGNAHNLRPARPFHVHDNLWFLSPDLPAPPAPPARWMAGRSGLRHTSCCLLDTSFCSKHSLSDPGFHAVFFFSLCISRKRFCSDQ